MSFEIPWQCFVVDGANRAVDLGVESWYADISGGLEVVSLDRLSGHFVLAPITVNDQNIWITVAYDHVSFFCFLPN